MIDLGVHMTHGPEKAPPLEKTPEPGMTTREVPFAGLFQVVQHSTPNMIEFVCVVQGELLPMLNMAETTDMRTVRVRTRNKRMQMTRHVSILTDSWHLQELKQT